MDERKRIEDAVDMGPVRVNVGMMIWKADTIVVARLELLPPVNGAKIDGFSHRFYLMRDADIVKGELSSESLLHIQDRIFATGTSPKPGGLMWLKDMGPTEGKYLLFLQRTAIEGAPEGVQYYDIVGNWKGILPLSRDDPEQYTVKKLEEQYQVSFYDSMDAFLGAIRFQSSALARRTKPLDGEAAAMYETLVLGPLLEATIEADRRRRKERE